MSQPHSPFTKANWLKLVRQAVVVTSGFFIFGIIVNARNLLSDWRVIPLFGVFFIAVFCAAMARMFILRDHENPEQRAQRKAFEILEDAEGRKE